MNFEEFKKAFDFLAEKFGMAVDWTSDNVLPYVKEVGTRVVKYKIITDSIGIAIFLLFVVLTTILFVKITKEYLRASRYGKNFEGLFYTHNCLGDLEIKDGCIIVIGVAAVIFVLSASFCAACISDLLKWIFIPELELLKYIKAFV